MPPQLLAEQNCARCIGSVSLENALRQIQSDRANFSHGRLPQVVLSITSTLAHLGRWGRLPINHIAKRAPSRHDMPRESHGPQTGASKLDSGCYELLMISWNYDPI
jgi:hypothetical protein